MEAMIISLIGLSWVHVSLDLAWCQEADWNQAPSTLMLAACHM